MRCRRSFVRSFVRCAPFFSYLPSTHGRSPFARDSRASLVLTFLATSPSSFLSFTLKLFPLACNSSRLDGEIYKTYSAVRRERTMRKKERERESFNVKLSIYISRVSFFDIFVRIKCLLEKNYPLPTRRSLSSFISRTFVPPRRPLPRRCFVFLLAEKTKHDINRYRSIM